MKDLQKLVGSLNKSGALNGFLGGVAGGGLSSLLGSKKGKKTGKKAVKYGALAAVGGLAWKAYKQYSEQSQEANQQKDREAYDRAMSGRAQSHRTFDFTPAQMPQQSFEQVAESDTGSGQLILMRAMIAAAYADGHIDETERQKIFAQVETMALSVPEKAMLFDELRKPLSLSELVQAVPDAQTGIEIYAASASAIDLQQAVSQQYLQTLANQLCLPRELVHSIHQELSSL
ncbi:tellurite resistance TerB family protein [Pseudoalteromonas luteoviolacea]|uniref:tellurite resistance TerB family protein n=1 Tax=Pseudoalteromonas luteoviolacea TaxID=43657 RepID=UPI001B39A309|nr:tellurite resistance TerB family protein [Pseudoalteromonas luteoviolacea]MBQ4811819.1 tellurite resistance TerB family protein [Pseudoalteromonas luteoviolacea]